jgi:hypothetical protein
MCFSTSILLLSGLLSFAVPPSGGYACGLFSVNMSLCHMVL